MIPDYCQFYQLDSDPFAGSDDVYLPQSLQSLLDKMAHLSQFSVGLLVVSGIDGSGKTTIADVFSRSFSVEQDFLRLDYRDFSSSQTLLYSICEYLTLSVKPNAAFGELLVTLRSFIHDVSDLPPVTVLIDNAHFLDDKALAAIVSLFQAPAGHDRLFQLVLMADPEIILRIDQLEMPGVLIQDLDIPRLSLEDVTGLLNDRMIKAGYQGKRLFSEPWVVSWWQSAEGNLSHILSSAREWLIEQIQLNEQQVSRSAVTGFPVVHLVAVAGLVSILVTIYLYQVDNEEPKLTVQSELLEQVFVSSATATLENKEAVGRSSSSFSSVGLSSVVSSSEATVPDTIETEEAALVTTEARTEKIFIQASSSVTSAVPRAEVFESLRPPSVKLSPDELTLLSWPPSGFTLQILGVSQVSAAEAFIKRQSNKEQLLMYSTVRQGKAWYVVVCGRHLDRKSALKAIADLPVSQRKGKPWVRSIKDIQGLIKEH